MVSIQSTAETIANVKQQKWYQYGNKFRALSRQDISQVLEAPVDGGIVQIYVSGGLVNTSVEVGPFRPSGFEGFAADWVREFHHIIPELDYEQPPGPGKLRYHCKQCKLHVTWDGVFNGIWEHN
jgi:hypothetical protein